MLMQVLTCNSKIKLDATFALSGTNDCKGSKGGVLHEPRQRHVARGITFWARMIA